MDLQDSGLKAVLSSTGTASTTPTAPRRILTLTYSSPGEDGETHHAIIPFPEQYEQAVTDALKLLGKYMANPAPQAKNVFLKYREKRDGEWIWAEFDPANWLLVVQPCSEIGVFEKQMPRSLAAQEIFWGGPIFVYGETKNFLTEWEGFNMTGRGEPSRYSINRPANYAEAVQAAKDQRGIGTAFQRVKQPQSRLTFYLFKDQRTWIAFPPKAMTDDEAWQSIVPAPGAVMGVIAT
ncbi:hypothetical protein B0H12DRAFT_1241902 [Mycena haematopus]|nr:hypothetical protein B0H12DRAFT_1241902 [Mycena haematopus]